jgi:hypothetical protein
MKEIIRITIFILLLEPIEFINKGYVESLKYKSNNEEEGLREIFLDKISTQ